MPFIRLVYYTSIYLLFTLRMFPFFGFVYYINNPKISPNWNSMYWIRFHCIWLQNRRSKLLSKSGKLLYSFWHLIQGSHRTKKFTTLVLKHRSTWFLVIKMQIKKLHCRSLIQENSVLKRLLRHEKNTYLRVYIYIIYMKCLLASMETNIWQTYVKIICL